MSVRLEQAEVDAFLAAAHTGVLTTLRSDGWPVSLPVWFVTIDGTVYLRTPSRTTKVRRVAHDDRVSFLVEDGMRWEELRAVVVTGRASTVDDPATLDLVATAFDQKYRTARPERSTLPAATRRHYDGAVTVLRIDAVQPPITWDNRKIRRARASTEEATTWS